MNVKAPKPMTCLNEFVPYKSYIKVCFCDDFGSINASVNGS